MTPLAGLSKITRFGIIWLSTEIIFSQTCVLASKANSMIVLGRPVHGLPQKCPTREQSNNLMSAVYNVLSYPFNLKAMKNKMFC